MANTFSPLLENGGPWEPIPNRKRWTRDECAFLVQSELLTGRYELIDGDILFKMGQNPPHSFVIMRLTAWLISVFGVAFVRMQLPIDVIGPDNITNEPEPDAAITSQPDTAFLSRNPGPSDLLLVVEVSDSTLRFDLQNKARLYARAGIVEYWVMDVVGRRLMVHRNPTPTGYAEVTEYAPDESVSPLARPDAIVRVADLLPPVQS